MKFNKTLLLGGLLFIFPSVFVYAGSIVINIETEDIYEVGDAIDISWESQGIDSSKTLALYLQSWDEGFLYPIKTGLPLKGSYKWTIPSSTADAKDYTLSLSTEDKGPSAWSPHSDEFEVAGGKSAYKITEYNAEVDSEDGGEGKITVYYETNRVLPKSYYLRMNINCPEDVEIESNSSKNLECKSWTGLDDRDKKFTLSYEFDSDEDQWVTFTIDLHDGSGREIQRVFTDQLTLPSEVKESKDNDNNDEDDGRGLFSGLSKESKRQILEFLFADDPDLLRLLELLIVLGVL